MSWSNGHVDLSSAFVRTAFNQAWEVAFFDLKGRFRGTLHAPGSRSARRRLEQIRRLGDAEMQEALARSFVAGKIANQRRTIQRAQRQYKDDRFAVAAARLHTILTRLPSATDLNTIRGHEGAASAAYFAIFPALIRNPDFTFSGRNRRPPRDPVNACLSFTYGLLLQTVLSRIHRVGLDPLVGALHEPAHDRPALALDLMEEWRPLLADSLILRLINRRQLAPSDFDKVDINTPTQRSAEPHVEPRIGGDAHPDNARSTDDTTRDPDTNVHPTPPTHAIHLAPTARRILIHSWLQLLRTETAHPRTRTIHTFERHVLHQTHNLAAALTDDTPYVPFTPR